MKTVTSAMKYEKTGLTAPLIKRKFAASLTKDITKLSTFRILVYVYRRHELGILQLAVAVTFTWAILSNM